MRITMILFTLAVAHATTLTQHHSVRTTTVMDRNVTSSIVRYGTVVAHPERITQITPRFGGFIVDLFVSTRYSKVEKGQPLARIYSPEVLQAKEEMLNSLNYQSVHANSTMLESAQSKLELLGVPRVEIDALIRDKKVTPLTTLYAPMTGSVFDITVEQGAGFEAKKMLFRLIDTQILWVQAKFLASEVAQVIHSDEVIVSIEGLHSYKAHSGVAYPALENNQALTTVRFEVPNHNDTLAINSFVTLTATRNVQARTLPRTALVRRDHKWYVFLATAFKGEYEPKEVRITPLNETYDAVEGLNIGDEVVLEALFLLDSDATLHNLYGTNHD